MTKVQRGVTYQTIQITDSCKGCGLCISTCPTRALKRHAVKPDLVAHLCSGCLECLEVCPADAIYVPKFKEYQFDEESLQQPRDSSTLEAIDVGF